MAADAVLHGELNVSVELDIQMPLGELLQRFVQVVMAGRAAAGVRLEREGVVQRGVCGRALDLNAVVQRDLQPRGVCVACEQSQNGAAMDREHDRVVDPRTAANVQRAGVHSRDRGLRRSGADRHQTGQERRDKRYQQQCTHAPSCLHGYPP